jgi:hypothetical protein
MISLRSRMDSWADRYSRASLWSDSERSVGRDEDARMAMTIEMEFCSAVCQLRM